jgi:hypothetical protein
MPLKEAFGKKPMKIDSVFKSRAEQLPVKRQGGISTMLKYNFAEYTMEAVRDIPVFSEGGFGLLRVAGNEVRNAS